MFVIRVLLALLLSFVGAAAAGWTGFFIGLGVGWAISFWWRANLRRRKERTLSMLPDKLPKPPPIPRNLRSSFPPDVISATRPPAPKVIQWLPPGSSITIAGRTIPGMTYISEVALGCGSESTPSLC